MHSGVSHCIFRWMACPPRLKWKLSKITYQRYLALTLSMIGTTTLVGWQSDEAQQSNTQRTSLEWHNQMRCGTQKQAAKFILYAF